MTADIHASMIATDFNQLASLRAEAANQSPGTLRKAAQQFESLFAQMLIKNMRATSLGDGVFDSDQSRFYRDLFDQQIAVELSSNGSLGIADLMVRQLGGPAAHENRIETKPIAADAREFAEAVWPHIQKAARELNVSPRGLLAQTTLETGWGKYVPAFPNGESSFNLFGIKAGKNWQGRKVMANTLEYEDGLPAKQRAAFRAYDSIAESVADYTDLLRNGPRYAEVLKHGGTPEGFATQLQRAGYATDPSYAAKVRGLANDKNFTEMYSALQNATAAPINR